MRKYIGDDILRRTLTLCGYDVKHVMNITDVGHLTGDTNDSGEDKLETGARKEGKTVWEVAEYYTDYFRQTMQAIHVLVPVLEPRATDHVADMIALVEKLIEKGYAYETDRAVYFDVSKDKTYGVLSRQNLADKRTASRDEVVEDSQKRNPADFSLWFKRIGRYKDHAMYWQSPWGDGFPGWHIECSAMAMKYLGETIDIHTGGIDHIPVHHENEIAQSECATGHEFVRYWVHYDFLLVDGEKMSKSKHNFYTIDDIREKKIDPLAVRLLAMQTSYRKPLNFTWHSLQTCESLLSKLQKFASKASTIGTISEQYEQKFAGALFDDLNTAHALSVVWEMLGDSKLSDEDKWATLLSFDEVLGLNLTDVSKFVISEHAKELMAQRDKARENKDFVASDKLRGQLEDLGYTVLDTPEGTRLD